MLKKIVMVFAVFLLGVAGTANAGGDKVSICHLTGSEKNPVVLISVSSNASEAHLGHGDFLLAPGNTDCSDTGPGPMPE